MLKVFENTCKNCLLSPDRIVSGKKAKEIIKTCAEEQTYFICHKASMKGEDTCCKSFFDNLSHLSKLARFAKGVGAVEFVEQEDSEKLTSYKEMNLNP